MRLSVHSKIRKSLQDMIAIELSAALHPVSRPRARIPGQKSTQEISKEIAGRMIGNVQFMETIGQLATKQEKDWLTTEEAAQLSGFSRPFIAALLDGPTYTGTVTRTEKGHRRVLTADFRQWLKKIGSNPQRLTVADVRTGFKPEPGIGPETAAEKNKRLKSRQRALGVARSLGIA